MLPKLPFETLTQIFSYFTLTLPNKSDVFPDYRPVRKNENEDSELARHLQDRWTLRALCIVCSRCRAVASPMLYHTVILHDAAALPFFMRTLLENPLAGNIVRDLALLLAFNNEYQERDLFNCIELGLWADLGQWLFGEAARKPRPREFNWNIRVTSNIWHNGRLPVQIRERKLRTTELVNDLKRDLCEWSGKRRVDARPPMHELIQGLLYCILRETPQVQRLLLQFPPDWGSWQNCFAQFRKLHDDNASSSPNFCSALVSLILASNSKAPRYLYDGYRLSGQFPFQYFSSLKTLMAVGPDTTFDPLRENIESIRQLHLLDTELQPRTLGSILFTIPQNLTSFVLKQRPLDPQNQPKLLDLPTEKLPTLSEVLLLKGSELRELSLILCYTHCFRNFIGLGKRLTSLPTLDRLEKLTIQMHLLFGDTRGFSANLLVPRLPPNLVELNIIDEWEMDVAERELWLTRYVYHEDDPEHDPIEAFIEEQAYFDGENGERHFCHVLHEHPVRDGGRYSAAQKRVELYSRYRMKVEAMLLDLAAQCDAGKIACQLQRANGQQERGGLASLRSVTFQIAPNKPLMLIPADEDDRYDGDWPHRLNVPPVKDSMENAISEIKAGSFLCWIPYRWTNLELLKENFNMKDNEMSVRYVRDVDWYFEGESDDESEVDEAEEENESADREDIGDDDENDENDENDEGEDDEDDEETDEDDEDDENDGDSEGDQNEENDEGRDDEENGENVGDGESEEGGVDDEDDEDDGNSESSEANETSEETNPQLLTLWNTFRAIPREHFMDVTAAFARSGVRFDCFGPAREWILAIRDAAKDEVEAKALSHVVEEEL